jgi:hypothetical protein
MEELAYVHCPRVDVGELDITSVGTKKLGKRLKAKAPKQAKAKAPKKRKAKAPEKPKVQPPKTAAPARRKRNPEAADSLPTAKAPRLEKQPAPEESEAPLRAPRAGPAASPAGEGLGLGRGSLEASEAKTAKKLKAKTPEKLKAKATKVLKATPEAAAPVRRKRDPEAADSVPRAKAPRLEVQTQPTLRAPEAVYSDTELRNRDMGRCRDILDRLINAADGALFREPVDEVHDFAPGYYKVIAEPMDFGTIRRRIEDWSCESPAEFVRLVRRVFINAVIYSPSRTNRVNVAARRLHLQFEQRFLNQFGSRVPGVDYSFTLPDLSEYVASRVSGAGLRKSAPGVASSEVVADDDDEEGSGSDTTSSTSDEDESLEDGSDYDGSRGGDDDDDDEEEEEEEEWIEDDWSDADG